MVGAGSGGDDARRGDEILFPGVIVTNQFGTTPQDFGMSIKQKNILG